MSSLQGDVDRVARQLASWVDDTQGRSRPHLFNRAAYVAARQPLLGDEVARSAVDNDDIVGLVADVTEGLIHQG